MSKGELKNWLHKKEFTVAERLLLTLATFDASCSVAELKERAKDAGWKIKSTTNVSSRLGKTNGLAINLPAGWELTDSGKAHLRNLGVQKISPSAVQVSVDLRAYLANIRNAEVKGFVEEAIKCHESELYRSAIVMTWLAAIAVLHEYVLQNKLTDFNNEAKRVDGRWKAAKTTDDLGLMKESEFLDRLQGISVLGKNAKAELAKALGLRNGCGHPNSLKVSQNMSAAHIEAPLLNVFDKFQI